MTVLVGADPAPLAQTQPVVWLDWEYYQAWLSGKLTHTLTAWGEKVRLPPPAKPGEHEAYIGPTGMGKTTHVGGRVMLRKYVIALDPKGEDETLSATGFVRVGSIWQDNWRWRMSNRKDARIWDDIWDSIEDGGDGHVIVGGPADSRSAVARLKALMHEAVEFCQFVKGWTMYVDEFEIMTSQEIFALRRFLNEMLIAARHNGTSVLVSYQAQAWVSKHPIRQCRRCTIWPLGDPDMIKVIAQGMGRNWREVEQAVQALPEWHTLTVPRGTFHPMVITTAPELGNKSQFTRGASGSSTGRGGTPAARGGSTPRGPAATASRNGAHQAANHANR